MGSSSVLQNNVSVLFCERVMAHWYTCLWIRSTAVLLRLASLGARPQAHVHMEGMKCRVLYLNVLGMNALFCEPKATPAP